MNFNFSPVLIYVWLIINVIEKASSGKNTMGGPTPTAPPKSPPPAKNLRSGSPVGCEKEECFVSEIETKTSTTPAPQPTEPGRVPIDPSKNDGYVFEEPLGKACVKWGNYLPVEKRESLADFRKRWTVPNPKNINEDCDSSKKYGECNHPLQCSDKGKCHCPHVMNYGKCQISPRWVPNDDGPGCMQDEDCVDLAECLLQFPCHCEVPVCKMAYGLCLCKHPVPPHGFRDGDCTRSQTDNGKNAISVSNILYAAASHKN